MSQRTGLPHGETQEDLGPEAPHIAQRLRVALSVPPSQPQARGQIKWPHACKTADWEQFDEDVDKVLEVPVKGEVDRRLQAMTTIITSLGLERFVT